MSFKIRNTVGFRISMYECDNSKLLANTLSPSPRGKDSVWIPQTMGDQIWLWFEFNNAKDAKLYRQSVIESNVGCVDPYDKKKINYARDMFMKLNQKLLDYWT